MGRKVITSVILALKYELPLIDKKGKNCLAIYAVALFLKSMLVGGINVFVRFLRHCNFLLLN